MLTAAALATEQVFEDSPALTSLWQATSDGSTDAFISQLIQNKEFAHHRSADGRGPMFWAYEFKNVDTLALLLGQNVPTDQEDTEGKQPAEFFPDSTEVLAEFETDAKAKVDELAALLAEREEEFYSYQNAASTADDDDDDYDDEGEDAPKKHKPKPQVDSIDYADDEDEEDENKDEM